MDGHSIDNTFAFDRGRSIFIMGHFLTSMQNHSYSSARESGFSRLEAILFLLILGTLAFLAVPVYNSVQLYRQSQMENHGESEPKATPEDLDSNGSSSLH